jgi:hypothetical protein
MPLLLLHARAATAWVVVRNVLVLPKDSTPRGQAARPACNWRARGGETYVNGKPIPHQTRARAARRFGQP